MHSEYLGRFTTTSSNSSNTTTTESSDSSSSDSDMAVQSDTIILALCTLALYFKVVVTLAKQGAAQQRPPEDMEELFNQQQPSEVSGLKDSEAQKPARKNKFWKNKEAKFDSNERWRRIVNNDMENIPLGLIILWAQVIVNANSATTSVVTILFTAARITHTVCYYYSIQPYRSIAFFVGLLSIFCAAFNMLAATL